MYFSVGGHKLSVRLAHVHLAQHTAANTQIGAGSISARRFNHKHRLAELHVFHLAISELHSAGVDISGRARRAPVAHREPYAGNVNAADFCTGRASRSNLHVLNNDAGHAVAARDVYIVGSYAIDLRA